MIKNELSSDSKASKDYLEFVFIEAYIASQGLSTALTCTYFLELPTQDSTEFCILVEPDNSKYFFTNINQLYAPIVSHNRIARYFFYHKFLTKDLLSLSYCLIQPIPLKQLDSFDIPKTHRINSFYYTKNWTAIFKSKEEFWTNRPSRILNTIKKKTNKCAEFGVEFIFSDTINSQLISDYWCVYNKSWKPKEENPRFIEKLLHTSSKYNSLRIGFASHENTPIAFCFWIVHNRSSFIIKLAQDSNYDHLSPGTILMSKMIDWLSDKDNIESIDFLTGDDPYKKDWMDSSDDLYGVEIFNLKTIRGRFLWYRHCLIRFLKSIRSRFVKHE